MEEDTALEVDTAFEEETALEVDTALEEKTALEEDTALGEETVTDAETATAELLEGNELADPLPLPVAYTPQLLPAQEIP